MFMEAIPSRSIATGSATSEAPSAPAAGKRFLFGPAIDFLCLGGSSLLLLPFLFMLPEDEYRAPLAMAMMLAANVINHPHFAHSYQIFYRNFAEKAFGGSLSGTMRARFIFAGLVAPALLVCFCAYGAATGDAQLLGYGGNLMGLAVGWHYVKQGYGMLMVDAALKRRFLDDRTKKIVLVNCYLVWLAAWVGLNASISKHELWGLHYYSFPLGQPAVTITGAAALLSSASALWVLGSEWKRKGSLPANGVLAYFVSLYLWLLFIHVDPLWAFVVPALHSIQYLTVVWRYQLNYERAQLVSPDYKKGSLLRSILGINPRAHMAAFVIAGTAIGFLGFWAAPVVADAYIPYDQQALSTTLFLFIFWMVINVHHYLLDNVMWRRENPDTRRYLFG